MMTYLRNVIREFAFIRWLPFFRAFGLAIFVLVVSIIVGFILGALDNGFALILKGIVI